MHQRYLFAAEPGSTARSPSGADDGLVDSADHSAVSPAVIQCRSVEGVLAAVVDRAPVVYQPARTQPCQLQRNVKNVNSFPSHKAHRAALISV